jgi:hypothetical protein
MECLDLCLPPNKAGKATDGRGLQPAANATRPGQLKDLYRRL